MLVVVNEKQDSIVGALAGYQVSAQVGPTSPTGWTAVWIEPEGALPLSELSELGELLTVAEDDAATTVRLVTSSDVVTATWPTPAASELRCLVDALQQRFAPRPGLGWATQAIQADDEDPVALLDKLLDLPQLDEPEPTSSVVAYRGNPSNARIAARVSGPALLWLHELGWLSLVHSGHGRDDPCSHELPYALSAAASRHDCVLELWRGQGTSAGLRVFRGGALEGAISWNTGWVHLNDELRDADRLTDLLSDHPARDEVDVVALRALLRARSRTGDPLRDFAGAIGISLAPLAALDGEPRLPEPERIERVGAWRAWWEEIAATPTPVLPKPARIAFAILTLAWLLSCAFVTALFAVVIATDGAFVDANRVERADWLLLALFGALTCLGIPLTIWRFRRALT